jgi:hypothetical protein
MKWSDLGNLLVKVAPTIASAVGTPLAGTAVAAIEGVLHLTPKPDATQAERQDAAAQAVAGATQEQLLALKEADQTFQESMAKLGFEDAEAIQALSNSDRASARQREVSIRDWTPRALAIGTSIGFYGLLVFISVHAVPKENKDMLNILLGSLGAGWIAIIGYYFGSSMEKRYARQFDGRQTQS